MCLLALLALLAAQAALCQSSSGDLKSEFENPPASARPRVWWHWMNGNITREGIKLDIDWMHRVGIAGFQNFDAALATPQVVEKRLAYMTPEWKDAFKYAITLADQYGMEMAIAGSPGWSESGGPWVPNLSWHEEVRMERDCSRRGQAISRKTQPSTGEYRRLSKHRHSRPSRCRTVDHCSSAI